MELKEHQINYILILLIPINAIISFIIENETNILKYFIAVIPFIIALIIYKIFLRYRFITNSVLYFFCSILCISFAPWDSPHGAIFLMFAIYTWNNKVVLWIYFIITMIFIAIKTIFMPEPTTRILNYVIAYAWLMALYFKKIHPKKQTNLTRLNEDNVNIMIIDLLMSGDRLKQIADKINLSQNAVTKRIEKMRDKYNAGNNIQLIVSLIKKGKIRLN